MEFWLAVGAGTLTWFAGAAVCFFNPAVDKVYRSEEEHPSVRTLPQTPKTIGKILLAVVAQTFLWAIVFVWIRDSLPDDFVARGCLFGGVISVMKIIPRDIDRLLLTTYPPRRMTIEFVVGILMAFITGLTFAYFL